MQPQRKRLSVNRRMPHILLACFLSSAVALGTFRAAFAHPLGNFTINRYSKLEVGAKELEVLYIVDMAGIPRMPSDRLSTQTQMVCCLAGNSSSIAAPKVLTWPKGWRSR